MAQRRPTEGELRLSKSAQRMEESTVEVLKEAVDRLVKYQEWLEHKLKASLATARSNGTDPDEAVRTWMDSRARC